VDIDLSTQEAEGQVWSSRLHAAVFSQNGSLQLEDLNSLNGTWLNGARVHPGQRRPIQPGDVVQVGTVQLRLVVE
jgi:pSer/pThr/pTyr-binding forkhead associated (FHA) protein